MSVLAKPHTSGRGSVVIEHLQLLPLPAQINTHVRTRYSQVRSTLVKAELFNRIILLQLNRLEVLQLTEIPELDAGVLSGCSQVVTVLREGNRGDRSHVAGEVGNVALFLQVPDLDLGVLGAGAKDQAVRVELGGGQADP